MEALFETLSETGFGVILIGAFILIAIFIEFFNNKPRT